MRYVKCSRASQGGSGRSRKRESDGFFDNIFASQRPMFSLSEKVWNPPADVYETPESVVIRMEVAGVDLDDLEITVRNNFLVIRGRRRDRIDVPEKNMHLMEVRYGSFERVFGIPMKLEADNIEAEYEAGFLLVTVGKSKPVSRRVDVRVVKEK